MDGVPINHQFGPIEMCQFSKYTVKPIFNEKNSIPP